MRIHLHQEKMRGLVCGLLRFTTGGKMERIQTMASWCILMTEIIISSIILFRQTVLMMEEDRYYALISRQHLISRCRCRATTSGS